MKTLLLITALLLGVLFPYGYEYTFLIRYFLMSMLFFSFLDIRFSRKVINKIHFVILAATIAVSVLFFFLLLPFDSNLAQAAFITAIAPTAIGAPVITSLTKGKVEFVTLSLLLNNIAIAFLIPFFVPLLMGSHYDISVGKILVPVFITISIPFALAQLLKFSLPVVWKKLVEWKEAAFYVWMLNIYVATSDASHYINSELLGKLGIVFQIALVSLALCVLFFTSGWLIGGKNYRAESKQAMGQKNNAFSIWVALTFMSPISVLGPIFYVFMQNLYISWYLYKTNQKQKGLE